MLASEIVHIASTLDKKTLYEQTIKLGEETGEVSAAVLRLSGAPGTKYKQYTGEDGVLEELADEMMVVLSMLPRINRTVDDLEEAIARKIPKWLATLADEQESS
jgi:NTP pyrophosphatase (non-canonical NTP hydrolase)